MDEAQKERLARKSGIANRLHAMLRANEPVTPIQMDYYVIGSFSGGFTCDGLGGWLTNPDGYLIFLLPECLARHGLTNSALILEKVRALFPSEARDAGWKGFYDYVHAVYRTKQKELTVFEAALRATKENYSAIANAIFDQHVDELPQPLPPTERRQVINPFTGKPM